jgi:penicillin-binding protein 1A
MKSIIFRILLVVLFITAFFWTGGDALLQRYVPAISGQLSSAYSTWNRVHQIFALKATVQAKVDKQSYTPLQNIPLTLQQAIIAVEDNRFYHHSGFDLEGILRATLVNLQTGSIQEGGSTITQQLVKNLFLSQDKTWLRKAEEVVLATDMEAHFTKEEILELYLNTIYFGSGANGITNAAKTYFGTTPANLTLAESALLAGLPNAPSLYSHFVDFSAAKKRQAVVLDAMARQGFIGPTLAQEAKDAPLSLVKGP